MSGTIYASSNDVGGVVGANLGMVENSNNTGSVSGSGFYVGGVVGVNDGTVETSYNTGSVSGGISVGGVVGVNSSGTVTTSYNTGKVSGNSDVGGVVGYNCSGTVEYSYNTGSVTGSSWVGGVVGYNTGTVETSYNTWCISGSRLVGGIVGGNHGGTVETSYNIGNVVGYSKLSCNAVGGVVGENEGTSAKVEYSYNTGNICVSGSSDDYVGGVVGENYKGTVKASYNIENVNDSSSTDDMGGVVGYNYNGTVQNTYYNTSVSYGSGAIGGGTTSGTGISNNNGISQSDFAVTTSATAGVSNLGAFNNWRSSGDFTTTSTNAPWFEGTVGASGATSTAPMLVADLPTATIKGNSGNSVYNGLTVSPGYTTTYTMGGDAIPSGITVNAFSGSIVGLYTVVSVSGSLSAPATQTSVGSVSVIPGVWTINPAILSFTGSLSNPTKVYDGTTEATLTPTNSSAILTGFVDGQGATYTGATGSYSSPNAGTGISVSATLGTGDFATFGNGFSWSNYALPNMTLSGTGTISPAILSFTGSLSNPTKVYDGTTEATLTPANSFATLTGFVDGQEATYTGATGSYSTANAGTGISVSATLGTGDFVTSGNGFSWSNYALPNMTLSGTGTIDPMPLIATANSASMTYGGSIPNLSGTLSKTGSTEGLANLVTFWKTTATSSSKVGSYAINPVFSYINGATSKDFSVSQPNSNTTALTIIPAPLRFSWNLFNSTKVYDGRRTLTLTTANVSATLSGFVNGQGATFTGGVGTYASPNVGAGIEVSATLNTKDFLTTGSGFSWSNYKIPTMSLSGSGTINPLSVTATANPVSISLGEAIPPLSGTFIGKTAGGSNISAIWTTPLRSTFSLGSYAINPGPLVYLNGANADDFIVMDSPANATALTVTGGITSTHFAPVAQTAALTLSGPGTSISGNSSDSGGSPSSTSEDTITLSSGSGTSLSVVSTGGGDLTGDGILSSQEVKP